MGARDLPVWIKVWFFISSVICSWDASFVLLRPHSMPPDGKYSQYFSPYALYLGVDKKYGDLEDTFIIGQAWCNVAEVVMMLFVVLFGSSSRGKGWIFSLVVSTMTFWKTVVFLIQYTDICNGAHQLNAVDFETALKLFYIPNGIWIVMSLLVMASTWSYLSGALSGVKSKNE
ncbi:uncharacterized protein TRIADDRAFT_60962 [Trichoplax adhaerens]|uniref:EXPERA domain-containing protein n=1 Tax=Trichoplax adhaerens TaxID=10228 RepID=B3S9M6_TRIAD|nr:hypothetical protein TRIADDRAFT_60962 [Trichoplax adhaerens]EDV20563.1 hypothetical protein TRIADDRAFT_60962 [Trichoplax adhaerens]|eukprot:XP_002116989.1 hypothetical protein TRIADDRAFT_60962 [Trichoplax adhaerens]